MREPLMKPWEETLALRGVKTRPALDERMADAGRMLWCEASPVRSESHQLVILSGRKELTGRRKS